MEKIKYAIITPAHNECRSLPKVIEGVVRQKIKPVKWIIIDDRSSDGTWELLKAASKIHIFIEAVKIDGNNDRMVGENIVNLFNYGYKKLKNNVDYIVKMDADIILEKNYFKRIFDKFSVDTNLGMVSGKTYIEINGRWVLERCPDTHVSGACKTYKKECFNDIGGLIPLLGWDILDCTKARMKGWKTRSYGDLPIFHLRQMGSAKGMFAGRLRSGRVMYTIRAHPLFVLGKSIYRSFEKPYFSGFFILFGYFASLVARPERLADMQLTDFLRREQIVRLSGKTLNQEILIPRKLTKG